MLVTGGADQRKRGLGCRWLVVTVQHDELTRMRINFYSSWRSKEEECTSPLFACPAMLDFHSVCSVKSVIHCSVLCRTPELPLASTRLDHIWHLRV